MMKRMIYQLISVYFFFGALASCSSEDEPGNAASDTGIRIELKTTGQTRSSVEPGTEAERQINSTSVWFFEDGAPDTEKAMFYTTRTSSSSTGSLDLNFTDEELRLHNMTSEESYEIYVVANLPADATINGETTLADLKGYAYTAASRPGSPFCMTGNSGGAHDFRKNSQISISLLRVASRLDITVKNTTGKSWVINKVSIAGDQKSVLLFAPTSGTTTPVSDAFGTDQTVLSTPTTNDEVVCSGYIYENRSADAVKVVIEGSVDGTAKTWTAELMPDGSTTLPRNTICGVTLNLKESAPIISTDVKLYLKGWNNEILNTELPATFLELNKKSLGVEYVFGGNVEVKSDAATIYVDWSKAPGFYLSDHESETEAVIPLTQENATLLFYFQGEQNIVIPDGIITITAGNLSQQIHISKINNNIIFHIKSIKINGHTISDGDIIPADFWGSDKDEPIEFVVATNVQWAYSLRGYMPSLGGNIMEIDGISSYNGISGGDSSSDTPPVMTNIKAAGLEGYLPVYVTIDFFLTTYEPGAEPYKFKTIHFTINN